LSVYDLQFRVKTPGLVPRGFSLHAQRGFMALSVPALVQKIDDLARAIGSDMKLMAGLDDAETLAARIAALESQWQSDMTKILSAQESLRVILDRAVQQTSDGTVEGATVSDGLLGAPYLGSRLPSGFIYGKGGINRSTGKYITGWQHVAQSIYVIISTPLGSRVMRRDFGSRIFDLMNRPMTAENVMEVYLATAEALDRWEPRFRLRNARIVDAKPDGHMTLAIYGMYYPRGHLGDTTAYEEPDGVLLSL
jgi:uncharacterized protein